MVLLYGNRFYNAISVFNIMKQLNENLKKLMQKHAIDDLTLARETGIPLSTLSRLKNSPDSNPTIKSLEPLALYFDIPISELIGEQHATPSKLSPKHLVPIIPLMDAQKWHSQVGANYAIKIITSIYEPLIPLNSIVLLNISPPTENDFVLVKLDTDPKPIFKRYLSEGSKPLLKSMVTGDNKIIALKTTDQILGVVCELRFSFKAGAQQKPTSSLLKNFVNYTGKIYALIRA